MLSSSHFLLSSFRHKFFMFLFSPSRLFVFIALTGKTKLHTSIKLVLLLLILLALILLPTLLYSILEVCLFLLLPLISLNCFHLCCASDTHVRLTSRLFFPLAPFLRRQCSTCIVFSFNVYSFFLYSFCLSNFRVYISYTRSRVPLSFTFFFYRSPFPSLFLSTVLLAFYRKVMPRSLHFRLIMFFLFNFSLLVPLLPRAKYNSLPSPLSRPFSFPVLSISLVFSFSPFLLPSSLTFMHIIFFCYLFYKFSSLSLSLLSFSFIHDSTCFIYSSHTVLLLILLEFLSSLVHF